MSFCLSIRRWIKNRRTFLDWSRSSSLLLQSQMWEKPVPNEILNTMQLETKLKDILIGYLLARVHSYTVVQLKHGVPIRHPAWWENGVDDTFTGDFSETTSMFQSGQTHIYQGIDILFSIAEVISVGDSLALQAYRYACWSCSRLDFQLSKIALAMAENPSRRNMPYQPVRQKTIKTEPRRHMLWLWKNDRLPKLDYILFLVIMHMSPEDPVLVEVACKHKSSWESDLADVVVDVMFPWVVGMH